MDDILNEVLSWEKILKDGKNIRYELKSISNSFRTIKEYKNSFESLFFEELKSQFDRILETNLNREKTILARVLGSGIKNKKFILTVSITKGFVKEIDKKKLALVIKKDNDGKKTKFQKCFVTISNKISKNGVLFLEMSFSNWINFNKKFQMINIVIFNQFFGLTGMVKEFNVLNSMENLKFNIKSIILSPKNNLSKKKEKIMDWDKIHLLVHFNLSQIKAIISFLKTDITLIQGPPGTGKTRTILGIISIINLIQANWIKKRCYYKTIIEKILICAPSNAATDENAMRASQSLILIPKGAKNWPFKITRLGPNFHFALDHLSLENYSVVMSSDIDDRMRLNGLNKIFRKIRSKIIKKTAIIFTTLACTGYSIMKNGKKNEIIIIDEAGQAIELSTLIPIKGVCKKIILIGDVQQLPATVFSKYSTDYGYNRSLFKRFQIDSFKIKFLENQYRMHPQISSFPARKFYRNCLKDSNLVADFKEFQGLRCFSPLTFFDVCEGQEQPHLGKISSWCNLDELRMTSFILRSLICLYPIIDTNSMGIIGGYNGQIDEIKDYKIIKTKEKSIQINTIDGFQGKEKDIIVFTCVRAKVEKGIGFLGDGRRVNVGFTRAKNAFWVIGNSFSLKEDKNWSEAIKDIKKRTKIISIRKPIERSIRKSIYWSTKDNFDYSNDGETCKNICEILLKYLKPFLQKKN
jgi:superfamily I DNA and/or RNA helicase